ncbi:MAG: hypothetical protein ACYS0G_05400 [Planctomycetota bacterium]
MTLRFDSCRLFFYLRDKAYGQTANDRRRGSGASGIVGFDQDLGVPNELDLPREDTLNALDELLAAELVRWVTPEEKEGRELTEGEGRIDALYVEPFDDLTAATILLERS